MYIIFLLNYLQIFLFSNNFQINVQTYLETLLLNSLYIKNSINFKKLMEFCIYNWLRRLELNQWSSGYEPDEIPLLYSAINFLFIILKKNGCAFPYYSNSCAIRSFFLKTKNGTATGNRTPVAWMKTTSPNH